MMKNSMAKKGIPSVISVLLIVVMIFPLYSFSTDKKAASGKSDVVLTGQSYVITYLRNKYNDSNAQVVAGAQIALNTPNYRQTGLNSYYRQRTGTAIDGTCVLVATTGLIEYYKNRDNFYTHDSYQDTFCDIVTMALNRGYYTIGSNNEGGGVPANKIDSVVTKSFRLYGSSNDGNNDYLNLYSTICDRVGAQGVPVLFSVIDHTMVACGYVTYTTTYTTSSGTVQQATDDFIVVNDGWSTARQYSYYPVGEISSGDCLITKVT